MTDRTKIISRNIKILRESAGWSQVDLAMYSGLTSSAISQIENGLRFPSVLSLIKIVEALNVSLESIIITEIDELFSNIRMTSFKRELMRVLINDDNCLEKLSQMYSQSLLKALELEQQVMQIRNEQKEIEELIKFLSEENDQPN